MTRKTGGFTILELMIVVTLIGLLAVIAVPAFQRSRREAQDRAFINDLRVLSDTTFGVYAIERGEFPPDASPGEEPADVGQYLPRGFVWATPPRIGGLWDWDRAATRQDTFHGCYAGISVYAPSRTMGQMRDIDTALDDGNLVTGKFRKKTEGTFLSEETGYIYVLE